MKVQGHLLSPTEIRDCQEPKNASMDNQTNAAFDAGVTRWRERFGLGASPEASHSAHAGSGTCAHASIAGCARNRAWFRRRSNAERCGDRQRYGYH